MELERDWEMEEEEGWCGGPEAVAVVTAWGRRSREGDRRRGVEVAAATATSSWSGQ